MKVITALLLSLPISILLTCQKSEKKENTNLLTLALLSSRGSIYQTLDINSKVGRASATSNLSTTLTQDLRSGGSGGLSFLGTGSQKAPHLRADKLFAMVETIFQNGKDPLIAREEARKWVKSFLADRPKEVRTAWTVTGGSESSGNFTATYSGTKTGKTFVRGSTTFGPCVVQSYLFSLTNRDSLTDQGTATFSSGTLQVNASANTMNNSGQVLFDNYGTLYQDQFALYRYFSEGNFPFPLGFDCGSFQGFVDQLDQFYKAVTVNGTLAYSNSFEAGIDQLGASDGNYTGGLNLKYTAESNSNDLTVTQDGTTTPPLVIENLVYSAEFDVQFVGLSFQGRLTLVITGKINGETLTETLVIDL